MSSLVSTASSSSSLPRFLRVESPPVAPIPSPLRLQALYASTSQQRLSNPTGYDVNAQWWASVLEETLRSGWINGPEGDRLVLKVDEALLVSLEDEKGVRPKGIGGIIERQCTTSPPIYYPLAHFISSPTPLHASPTLAYRFVGRPLWWAMSQLNPFGSSEPRVETEAVLWKRYGNGRQYVHMPLLEQSAALFTAHMREHPLLSYSSSLFSPSTFYDEFSAVCFPSKKGLGSNHRLSRADCQVLVRWLGRDCGLLVSDDSVIKLLEPGQVAADHPISEADAGTLAILETLRKVEAQITDIERQISACQAKAKHHLVLSQKSTALSYLRSKKALEDVLARRVGTSEQLASVIRSIDQAKDDVGIVEAYSTASATLKGVLAHPSLDREYVERTTDELSEVMANQEEVDEAVRVGGQVAMGTRVEVDDDEVAGELEELIKEEKERQEAERIAEQKRIKAEAEQKTIRDEAEKEKAKQAERAKKAEAEMQPPPITALPSTLEMDDIKKKEWEEVYAKAQEREREEKARAEQERLQKEARRVAAE
ncbi:Snf7-domain-containing protein [Naematelia encephala]|uniref:Snf7-domain-containing protein n=1 Tax=Naematelia encephala TaxID=71784 RepID=A0A1Y2B5X1_9TREE|nr:Snf7-domain-containing protein [Naematelia encephala]